MAETSGCPEGGKAGIPGTVPAFDVDCAASAVAEYDYRNDLLLKEVVSEGFRVVISTDEPRCVDVSVTGTVHGGRTMQVMQSWQIQLNDYFLQLVPDVSFHTYRGGSSRSPTDAGTIASDADHALKTSLAIDLLEGVKEDLVQHFALSAIEEWRMAELTALKAEDEFQTAYSDTQDRRSIGLQQLCLASDEARFATIEARSRLVSVMRMAKREVPHLRLPVDLDPQSNLIVLEPRF